MLPDGFLVLFNTKSDWAHTLNPRGALVWEFCDGAHTPDQICEELASVLGDCDRSELRGDVQKLIETLLNEGLLSAKGCAV